MLIQEAAILRLRGRDVRTIRHRITRRVCLLFRGPSGRKYRIRLPGRGNSPSVSTVVDSREVPVPILVSCNSCEELLAVVEQFDRLLPEGILEVGYVF